jgi:hypothetical protein
MGAAEDAWSGRGSMPLVSPARFPEVRRGAGHYESYYLKTCHPHGGLGAWIRYTVHKRPDAPPKGFVWFTLFDRGRGVAASKVQLDRPRAGQDHYIAMGGCRFAPGHVTGRAPSEQLDAAWDLRFEGAEPAVWHLPRAWMYRAPLPRTKILSPHPHVRFAGWIEAGGRRIDLDGWPGMVGHNWGAEHAKRALWLHGTGFDENRDAWLDVAIARVALGPITTPWIANGELCLDGRRHRLGGPRHLRSTRIEESIESCRLRLTGDGVAIIGTAGARRQDFVGWIYAQPSGEERQTINCSVADMRLEVSRPGIPPVTLAVDGGAAYELQMDDRYPQIPVQPFPDG